MVNQPDPNWAIMQQHQTNVQKITQELIPYAQNVEWVYIQGTYHHQYLLNIWTYSACTELDDIYRISVAFNYDPRNGGIVTHFYLYDKYLDLLSDTSLTGFDIDKDDFENILERLIG